ncbi:hypothetical protein BC30048_p2027 (plasmid) [Bacillus cereus]|jgi:hypothetical protein|uniref:hypothetical protein n=1 Tax=Bacillus cereus TaxID=1396 RepID=UPI001F3F41AA|nr:hypothetical protein [Bacillus cereus]BCC15015.1 hypothetical protein BCM0074_p1019 [Bacillus cereus]BCD02852.1 hypothetical protein BC30048_p2027 [Bacillus cereus]
MEKCFLPFIILFLFICSIPTYVEFAQTEIMHEVVKGLFFPLTKWYIAIPMAICSISFGMCILFEEKKYMPFILMLGLILYLVGATIPIFTEVIATI